MIEGNFDLLYRRHQNCSLGEQIGDAALEDRSQNSQDTMCHPDHLGLQGAPDALKVVVLK